ncbi:MAG: universal stress protein [Desulfatiglandales bacterium]
MLPIKRIMAAVDLSEYSEATLAYATYLKERLQTELFVVNIINERDVEAVSMVAQFASNISVEKYISEQKAYRMEFIKQILKKIGCAEEGVDITIAVGTPFSKILELINEKSIDLVIVGAKGRSNIATIFLGSTSERIAKRSPIPVLVVREKIAFKEV